MNVSDLIKDYEDVVEGFRRSSFMVDVDISPYDFRNFLTFQGTCVLPNFKLDTSDCCIMFRQCGDIFRIFKCVLDCIMCEQISTYPSRRNLHMLGI